MAINFVFVFSYRAATTFSVPMNFLNCNSVCSIFSTPLCSLHASNMAENLTKKDLRLLPPKRHTN